MLKAPASPILIGPPLVGLSVLALLASCSPQPAGELSDRASDKALETVGASPAPEEAPPRAAPSGLAASALPVARNFQALGTEPFWSAKVEGTRLTWSTPERPEGEDITVSREDRAGRAVVAGTVEGKAFSLEVWHETCSDGMSDTVYPMSAIRRLGDDVQRGCAR